MESQVTPNIFAPAHRSLWHLSQPSIWSLDGNQVAKDPSITVLRSLFDQPRWLEAYNLYDDKGSHLFELICELPEYYSTRTESSILEKEAQRIIELAPVECIVELGAGFSKKTLHLLKEQVRQRSGGIFAPLDVSPTGLAVSREVIREQFPQLTFHGLQAQFEEGMEGIEKSLPTLFVFLGSTIGNFSHHEFVRFFRQMSASMGRRDYLLLGVDRVKDVEVMQRAYNDSQGITAQFILNVFENVNRLVQSNFDQQKMRFHSRYNPDLQRIEMSSVSTEDQEITFPAHGASFVWKEQQKILVEISRKFDPLELQKQLKFFGLTTVEHFSDPKQWFSLLLLRKTPPD
ncbi:MAG: L-histidine N(alpha)-methyltransferase [Deltaproteobacteria bacterium]|nr:L-histidine N(alpha)-methyltransferase [Deltaproteobacteria bacterium]